MPSTAQLLEQKLTSSDIIILLSEFGVPETSIRYTGGALVIPTICHNELLAGISTKLYYYENTKRFYCYTHCKAMSVFDLIINVYKARGYNITFSEAYTKIQAIVSRRIETGFAIIETPKPYTKEIREDWENQLTVYNDHVIDCFSRNLKYLKPWIKEGLTPETLHKFNVRFDMINNRIVFPVIDRQGRLVGVKCRNFNQEDIDNGRKYMPLWYHKETYTYPKMMVLFGFFQNMEKIKEKGEAVIVEAEKGVMLADSFLPNDNNFVAIGGSSVSAYHARILQDAGINNIVLGLDRDPDDAGDYLYGLKKEIAEGKKLKEKGFNVWLMYDWDGTLLQDKDAPIDRGKDIYNILYANKRPIEDFIEEEDEIDEVSVEDTDQL